MLEMLAVVGACTLPSLLLVLALRRWRNGWSRWRISLVSAGFVPALVLAVCLYLFVIILMTPADQCGIDACAMGKAGAIFIGMWAIAAFALGMVLAQALQSVLERQ